MSGRAILVTTALAALCLLPGGCGGGDESSPAAPAASSADAEWPLKAIWGPVRMPDGGSAFSVYDQLAVDVYQTQLQWSTIATRRPASAQDPDDPAYRWPEKVDEAIAQAPTHGIDVAILVSMTPNWANGDRGPLWAPDEASDYADFLAAAARRYPTVHRWMIWGEPNRSDHFLPNAEGAPVGPRRYAELLDGAYGALKQVSADNIVIGGMSWTGGDVRTPDFLRWMRLPSGEPPRLDWYGHNPYPFRFPSLATEPHPGGWRDLSDLDTIEAEVRAAYAPTGRDPPLWLSEFTVQSDHRSKYFVRFVSRAEQARWLRAGYEAAKQVGSVAGLGWFTLLDQPEAPGSADWGLMTAKAERKPAFSAYADLAP